MNQRRGKNLCKITASLESAASQHYAQVPLEKEVFSKPDCKQTDASVPRVLGYGKKDSVEYILMTKWKCPVENTKFQKGK